MKTYRIPTTTIDVSVIGYGCMKLGGSWEPGPVTAELVANATRLIDTALEQGINFFDHADIYARGRSEAVFGEALAQRPGLREQIIIQSKCGIRFGDDPEPGAPGRYDFSYSHIIHAVEGSLKRLKTDYLDILLLHRPDPLVEPEEVARAFDELHRAGKARMFGVSNHTPGQIDLLRKSVDQPLLFNQVELNLLHNGMINDGIVANQAGGTYTGADGILDYCRLHNIMIQAWGPVANGRLIDPPGDADERTRGAAAVVAKLADEKGTTREAIALAWLLRHPAGIQPIVGTTQAERIVASAAADGVTLSREEWYTLFVAGRGKGMP